MGNMLDIFGYGGLDIFGSKLYEGNYTTWSIQGIYDPNISAGQYPVLYMQDDGIASFNRYENQETYLVSSTGSLLATLTDQKSVFRDKAIWWTSSRKYVCFKSNDREDLIVNKGVAELWRRSISDDKGEYTLGSLPLGLISISPSGEYIVVMVKQDTGNSLLFIYKGS